MREQHALICRRGQTRFDKLGRWMGAMTPFSKRGFGGLWSYCCFCNEQDSSHGAAVQPVARERLEIVLPLALRCAKHLFLFV